MRKWRVERLGEERGGFKGWNWWGDRMGRMDLREEGSGEWDGDGKRGIWEKGRR